MALILPRSYHKISAVERNRISWIEAKQAELQDIRPLRIGILNIMPLGKQYEFNLLHPLGLSVLQIEPIWIRLNSHTYKSWDQDHLNQLYVYWDEARSQGPLDGLIITGAPVEHLPFEHVRYWKELTKIIEEARESCASTLGLSARFHERPSDPRQLSKGTRRISASQPLRTQSLSSRPGTTTPPTSTSCQW